jgi:D-sedoheptulose 7-phosphate isomerase
MYRSDYLNFLLHTLNKSDLDLEPIVYEITKCIGRGNSIWIMGNGGSASTAEHFETDLSFVRLRDIFTSVKVSSLTANSALITAIANDIGFEYVFSHQLQRKATAGDVCLVISASGNSLNLLEAVSVSKHLNLVTVGILGFDGGKLAELVDHSVIVSTEIGKYGPVEDIHLAICHELSSMISLSLLKKGDV